MTLDDIVGQRVTVSILKRGLLSGNLGHAYLFSGPPGLGKETTARAVANALVTKGGPFSEIRIFEGQGSISIDEVRQLRQTAAYAASGNTVWIILDAERMSVPASNAFLKTLEEPHLNTYFFLTTTRVNRILPTIVSRCQHLPFLAIAEKEIVTWLANRTGRNDTDPSINSVARLAQGSLGKAWQYWEGSLLEYRAKVIDRLISVPTASYPEILGLSQTWSEDKTSIHHDAQLLLEWHRDLLAIKNGVVSPLYNPDYYGDLQRIAAYYSNHSLFLIIQRIGELSTAIQGNARIRFFLNDLLLLMKKGALT